MPQRIMQTAVTVFFCTIGWICITSATGAEPTDGAAIEGVSLFEQDQDVTSPTDADGSAEAQSQGPVQVDSFGQIDLHVKDLDVSNVLQLLSMQSQRNIIASRNVAGTISADLYSVDFYEAMDAVLHANGFGYKEDGKFIYVYTADELAQIEEKNRKTITRVVRLNYLTAVDAATFVKPLISSQGSVAVSAEASTGIVPSESDLGENSWAAPDTLVIHDYAENVDAIVQLVKELDSEPRQVLIESTILQAKLTEENAFGVDLTILADTAVDKFASPFSVIDDLVKGTVKGETPIQAYKTSVGQTNTGPAGLQVGVVTHSVAAFIKALDQVTDTTVLANPKLLVLNRQKADLLVGERLGYISSTNTDTATTQTVEFLDVGTQLTVRPFVSDTGKVRLELRPSISDGSTTVSDNFVIPNTNTQELFTNVIINDGQTVVLGGLFKEDTTIGRRQVPGLGEVPLVNVAFKGQDDSVIRSEVIFLIRPTIVKDESLYAVGQRTSDDIEELRLGARKALLPWSRTKLTASHMRQAQKYLDEGDTVKARYYADLALNADATTLEAIHLKRQLGVQRAYWQDKGIMEDAINDVIQKQLEGSAVQTVSPQAQADESQDESQAQADETQSQATEAVATSDEPDPTDQATAAVDTP